MLNLILAISSSNGGIGLNGSLPWSNIKDDLNLFRTRTMDSIMIVGRKTFQTIKDIKLSTRKIIVVGQDYKSLEEAISEAHKECIILPKKIFIIGGKSIYDQIFEKYNHLIDKIFLTHMKDDFVCDTFVNVDFITDKKYIIEERQEFNQFTFSILKNTWNNSELQYLHLLSNVYENGIQNIGRNGLVSSCFSKSLNFDLRFGFPLLTTKKMFFRGIVEELIFFLKGQTDTKILESKNINIWKGNTSREFLDKAELYDYKDGQMGPMYGFQWRHFGAEYEPSNIEPGGMDQLLHIIHNIKMNPKSRRLIMTDFNPLQADEGVLFPCHSIILQFFVEDGFLDMFCFNRSSDLFLGLPFNIASSSLMLIIIAYLTNLIPRKFHLSLGDCHIYKEHFDAVEEQLTRIPYHLPSVKIVKPFSSVEKLTFDHFELENYLSHSSIKAPMIS